MLECEFSAVIADSFSVFEFTFFHIFLGLLPHL